MSEDIVDRINDSLHDNVIGHDMTVSMDAMRSRPPTEDDHQRFADGGFIRGPGLVFVTDGIIRPPLPANLRVGQDPAAYLSTSTHDWGGVVDRRVSSPTRAQQILLAWFEYFNDRLAGWRQRRWDAKHPVKPVTVTIFADTRAFNAACRRFTEQLSLLSVAAKQAAEAMAKLMPPPESPELRAARAWIRDYGNQQHRFAQLWLRERMDTMYADLGLERTE